MTVEFSIIMPTYRRPAQLRQAAASVLSQRDVNLELFIIDDSPEGSARDVVASLKDTRAHYILNPSPTGGFPSQVRNLALSRATGDFVHFLDDDDIVPANHYLTMRQAFARHPDVGMIFGCIEPFGDCAPEQLDHERRYFQNAARKASTCQRWGKTWGFTAEMLFGPVLLVCGAAICRRECALALNGFDPAIRIGEDCDFFVRMMRRFGAHFLDRTTLHYRIGSPSLMHDPKLSASQLFEVREGRRRSRNRYRSERGAIELHALAALQVLLLGGLGDRVIATRKTTERKLVVRPS